MTYMKQIRSLTLIIMMIVSAVVLVACGVDALQKAVDIINSDEEMHAEMAGLFTVYAEARGNSTMVVTFKAEMEELATVEVAQAGADAAASDFQVAVEEMRNARITDPKVILEFLDMDGNLLYSREFS